MQTDAFTPAQIEQMLYDAGRALMALRVPGCWPAGYRSNMPEVLRDPEDMRYAETEFRPALPSPAQVDNMDLVLEWLCQLPGQTRADIRLRKLVGDRMRVSPRTDKPIFSWRRLGALHGVSHVWAKTLWIRGVAEITVLVNRRLPQPCADTMARIRAFSAAHDRLREAA